MSFTHLYQAGKQVHNLQDASRQADNMTIRQVDKLTRPQTWIEHKIEGVIASSMKLRPPDPPITDSQSIDASAFKNQVLVVVLSLCLALTSIL